MKPTLAGLDRRTVHRVVWMQQMLLLLATGSTAKLWLRDGKLQIQAIVDFGKALLNQPEGFMAVAVPDDATDDEAEAILRKFVDDLPEPA